MDPNRYANGSTKQQQLEANARYREKQRTLREWVDNVAHNLGEDRDQLVRRDAAFVAAIIRQYSE